MVRQRDEIITVNFLFILVCVCVIIEAATWLSYSLERMLSVAVVGFKREIYNMSWERPSGFWNAAWCSHGFGLALDIFNRLRQCYMILHLAAAVFLISSSHFNPSYRPFYVYGRFHADAFLASSITQRLGMSSGEKANEAVRTSENHQARGF